MFLKPLRKNELPYTDPFILSEKYMYYLAYGSNLHPLRLILRVPNARLVGTARLKQYRLTFHKRSTDGSAKCNLDFSENSGHVTHVAVYEMPENEVHLLDTAEGLGNGYWKHKMSVKIDDKDLDVFVYLASSSHLVLDLEPYHWYKDFVLAGARKHQFPTEYIEQISIIASKHDPEDNRRNEMENLLVQLNG